jgi:hypothetical protein
MGNYISNGTKIIATVPQPISNGTAMAKNISVIATVMST